MSADRRVRDVDDCALAHTVAGGEGPDAEAELYRRLAPRVRAYGLRHLRDASLADDLVQTVLLLTIDKLRRGEVDLPERIASFALGVSRRVARDWRRGERRQQTILDSVAPALREAVAEAREPMALVDRQRLAECLGKLTQRQRTVVLLSFYAEQSGPEIAAELGASAANVRVMRHRALGSLHDCVEGGAA